MPYRPKLDPARDLAGATPRTLALALLGKKPSASRARGEPVADNEPPVKKPAPDKTGNGVAHLSDGV